MNFGKCGRLHGVAERRLAVGANGQGYRLIDRFAGRGRNPTEAAFRAELERLRKTA
jgi:hypothetical protein